MKSVAYVAMLAVAMSLAACAAQKRAGPTAAGPVSDAGALAAPTAAGESADAPPAPPEGALYTLWCYSFTGPDHIAVSTRIKQQLIQQTHLKDWYVVHGQSESDLYYGYYKTHEDVTQTEEYARAQADHAKMLSLRDEQGDRLFPMVVFVTINQPDPPAPKEWELSHNPGYWTLQIAIYRDSPQRKQAAVDAVRDARARGIEAYYQHGSSASGVFIGSWPKEAAHENDASTPTQDPTQPLLIRSNPVAGTEDKDFYTKEGRKVKVIVATLEVSDPTLRAAMTEYPYTYVNGQVMGRTGRDGKVIPYPCCLIPVPHEDAGQEEPASPGGPVQPPPGSGLDGSR